MELPYQIALTCVEGVGPVIAKNLISYCGSASEVFKQKKTSLLKIPEVGEKVARAILEYKSFDRAENELHYLEKNHIKAHFYTSKQYPYRLKSNADCPVLLYQAGDADLNAEKMISVVGTRKPSEYGTAFCDNLIQEISGLGITVISGMAYGIDICAHKAALKNNIPTLGVLAHGLDRIYPSEHARQARSMREGGGALVSEFVSGTAPDRENFPKRNRIVAGLCDALVVVETAKRGGSMITAELAWQYDRTLLAVPGRAGDEKSAGCNYLIKTNKAELIENAWDLIKALGMDTLNKTKPSQKSLPLDFSQEETLLWNLFKSKPVMEIDEIMSISKLSSSQAALTLLDLEFKGYIKSLPGKRFQLI